MCSCLVRMPVLFQLINSCWTVSNVFTFVLSSKLTAQDSWERYGTDYAGFNRTHVGA